MKSIYNRKAVRKWGYGSVGRAPRSQRGGQRFESAYLHQKCRAGKNLPCIFVRKVFGRTARFVRHMTDNQRRAKFRQGPRLRGVSVSANTASDDAIDAYRRSNRYSVANFVCSLRSPYDGQPETDKVLPRVPF